MGERLKILKMLEEGKISVEEAARLLQALGAESRGEREGGLGGVVSDAVGSVSSVLATIPGIVKAGLSVGVGEEKRSIQASPKERVVIKSVGGDLVVGISEDTIVGEIESGVVRSSGSDEELVLRAIGGDARLSLPRVKELRVSSLGGDVRGEIAASTLSVGLTGGDVKLSLEGVENAVVKSTSGDIELAIPEDSNISLDLQTASGEVTCGLRLTKEERGENYLRGVLNKPRGNLQVRTLSGDIKIEKRP